MSPTGSMRRPALVLGYCRMATDLDRLAERATWHAEETVVRPIAFVLMFALDGREILHRIVGASDSAEALQEASSIVSRSSTEVRAYAIASDGYLRVNDSTRLDAIFFHCGVRGEPEGIELARPYEDDGERVHWTHEPVVLGEIENLLGRV